jgi:hypothetical protein
MQWGRTKWKIAPLKKGGWGAVCDYHTNFDNGFRCKKEFSRRGFTDEQHRIRIKQWLLAGMDIDEDAVQGQCDHVRGVDPGGFPDRSEADVDAEMATLVAGFDH